MHSVLTLIGKSSILTKNASGAGIIYLYWFLKGREEKEIIA